MQDKLDEDIFPNLSALSGNLEDGSDAKEVLSAFSSDDPDEIANALTALTSTWKEKSVEDNDAT